MGNQYIGARYVPKFDNAWNSTKVYEPLTIVDYGNTSYISMRNTPAGTLPTNTDFWKPYIVPSPSLTELEEEVNTLSGEVAINTADISQLKTDINKNMWKGRKCIWLGDSWLTTNYATTIFPAIISEKLGFSYNKIYGISGCGWVHAGGYAPQIDIIYNELGSDIANSIDYFFIYGSINDNGDTNSLSSAVDLCKSKVKQNFPNAELIAIPCLGNNNFNAENTFKGLWYTTSKALYNVLVTKGIRFYYEPFCLLLTANTFDDGIHPNNLGNTIIANTLINDMLNQQQFSEFRLASESTVIYFKFKGNEIFNTFDSSGNLNSVKIAEFNGMTIAGNGDTLIGTNESNEIKAVPISTDWSYTSPSVNAHIKASKFFLIN